MQPRVWALALAYFGVVLALYGFNFWLPRLISAHGVRLRYTGWIAALPFLCGAPFMVWWGRHSDRLGERVRHLIVSRCSGLPASRPRVPSGLCPARSSASVSRPWACTARFRSWDVPDHIPRRHGRGGRPRVINSFGNLAGYVGPQVVAWLTHGSGDYRRALFALGVSMLTPAIVVLGLRPPFRIVNRES